MSKVGFLGLGAMGSRMATNILKAGHTVTVWNRSPEAAEALVASGPGEPPLRKRTHVEFPCAMTRRRGS